MSTYKGNSLFADSILKVFPPPRFLEVPAAGIDISDNSVRFLELEETKLGKVIKKHGSYPITPNSINNGKIIDIGQVAESLAQVRNEQKIKYIHASLPEEQAFLFQTTIPNTAIDQEQLKTILEFKLEENVPISSRDLVFDYEAVEEEKADEIILNITAFPKETIAGYIESFNAAGLITLSFEIEGQSLARSIIPENHNGTYMIVDFGKKRTGIAIVSGEKLRFTSTVAVGGATLSRAIEKNFGVKGEEADRIKNEKGLARYKDNNELLETLITTVSVLRDEIRKHYTYWNTHTGANEKDREKIDKIILCGGSANLAGLPEYLSADMNVVVEVANVWANTFSLNDFIPDINYRHSLAYATSVGLALKGTNQHD